MTASDTEACVPVSVSRHIEAHGSNDSGLLKIVGFPRLSENSPSRPDRLITRDGLCLLFDLLATYCRGFSRSRETVSLNRNVSVASGLLVACERW